MDTFFEPDPRTARLPMGSSVIPTYMIIFAYLSFVKVLGPAWMKNRKPYNLRGLLILHNFFLVIANAWMFYKYGTHGWFSRYSWTCANLDSLETEDSLAIVDVSWYFFISKFIEMGDTVFFVFRKKYSHISFLHVVHHSIVPLIIWYIGLISASGFCTLFGFLNSFVHIWMYLYYGLAALGPSVQKYLWWKKYLTTLQIIQFCVMMLATISVIVTPGCKVPMSIIGVNLITALFFLVLFANFYRNSYKSRKMKLSENGDSSKLSKYLNVENGKLNNNALHKD